MRERTRHKCGKAQRQKGTKAQRGFTLLETLIAITVLAILASVVITSPGSSESQRLEAVARVLAADLRLARNLAISYDTEWTVRFDIETGAYELVHTGSGTPPPLENPFAPGGKSYRIIISHLGTGPGRDNGVRLAAARLKQSRSSVTEVTFGPLGGTGPARSEDTVIRLTKGVGGNMRAVDLTISWITGQVWMQ